MIGNEMTEYVAGFDPSPKSINTKWCDITTKLDGIMWNMDGTCRGDPSRTLVDDIRACAENWLHEEFGKSIDDFHCAFTVSEQYYNENCILVYASELETPAMIEKRYTKWLKKKEATDKAKATRKARQDKDRLAAIEAEKKLYLSLQKKYGVMND